MISKLPRWVWIGGVLLAFIAGMVNAVGFLSFQHQGVTHLTGTTTLMGIEVAHANWLGALHLFWVIAAFVAGAALSGFIIQDSTLKLGQRYGVALIIEAVLLIAAVPLLQLDNVAGDYLASCACGIQNAMASTYSGAVLRTTHVSGMLTDIGIFLGHWLRRLPLDWRRVRLCFLIPSAFFAGGVLGGIAFVRFSYQTLYFPALLTGATGLAYVIYRYRHRSE